MQSHPFEASVPCVPTMQVSLTRHTNTRCTKYIFRIFFCVQKCTKSLHSLAAYPFCTIVYLSSEKDPYHGHV